MCAILGEFWMGVGLYSFLIFPGLKCAEFSENSGWGLAFTFFLFFRV